MAVAAATHPLVPWFQKFHPARSRQRFVPSIYGRSEISTARNPTILVVVKFDLHWLIYTHIQITHLRGK